MDSPSEPTRPGGVCPACGAPSPDGSPCPSCAETGVISSDAPTWEVVGGSGAVAASTPAPARKGPERIDRYKIVRELGAGGMGAVYLAHDEKMNRDVALKVLSRHQAPSAKADRRFEQEAWIAGKLDHPNLVKVYGRGTWEELSYYSMEVVEGGSLEDVIQRLRDGGHDEARGLEFGSSRYVHWAIRKIIEAARGLDYAHRQGVVHRDIKPMNLLLSKELDAVKVADFGLALDESVTRMTTAGKIMGTVTFMAPEQILGKQDEIDARTDIYALAVTLFEMLTLELPFSGRTQQMYMSQVLATEARRASKINAMVSRDLETVLRKAMEKERNDRYPTMSAFADDLENVLHLRPIQARPAGPVQRAWKWVRRKPVHAALLATLVVSLPTFVAVGTRVVQNRIAARQARIDDLLSEARWLEERQRFQEVLARTAAVLEMDRDNPIALRHRAVARFGLSRDTKGPGASELVDQSLDDVSRVIALEPEASWPHALRAWMLAESGREDEAAAERGLAERYRAEVPSEDDLSEEARLAMGGGRYDAAIDRFTELLVRRPGAVQALASRAHAYEEVGDAESALTDYRVAIGLDPDNELAHVDLARLSTDRGRLDDGERYIRRALELDPENGFALEIQSYVLIQRGIELGAQGDRDAARRALQQAEAAAERALGKGDDLLFVEINLANSLTERNRLLDEPDPGLVERAVAHYRNVLDRWPSPPARGQGRDVYAAALGSTCDAQIQLERLEDALPACSRFTVLFPDNAVGFYNLAGVYALLGRADEALAALRRDLALGDTDWEYLEGDRWFEGLRGDPRFAEIVERMKRRAAAG